MNSAVSRTSSTLAQLSKLSTPLSRFNPVKDQNQTKPWHCFKIKVGLGFVGFVSEDVTENVTVGSHDDLGHRIDTTLLVHQGDVAMRGGGGYTAVYCCGGIGKGRAARVEETAVLIAALVA